MAGLVMGQVTTTYSTSGSYTFTVPAGVTSVTVECWGGGGNGGNRTSNGTTGGGGGGAYARSVISVVPGSTYDVRVGTGGSATLNGADSWFINNTAILAKGGASVGNNISNGAAGGSGAASIGDVTYSGGNGANSGGTGGGGGSSAGTAANGANGSGQNGGSAPAGGADGGDGANAGFFTPCSEGDAGSGPGGGGGGSERTSNFWCSTVFGGAGADGQVSITYVIPPPMNDVCSSATSLSIGASGSCPSGATSGSTLNSTADGSFSCDGAGTNNGVWYSFTAPAGGAVNLLINEVSGNHEAAIFDACGGTEVFCDNTPNSESVTGLTPSAQYFIVVWSDAGNEGDHEICLELPPTPPVNDDCASAVNLIPGTSCVPVTGNVALATQSIPAITCNTFTGDANDDVWYSFVAAATSETVEVTGSVDFDAVVDLRDGCTGNNIACADATLEGGTEQIVATGLTVGNTYFVRVYHYYTAVPATTGFDICVYHLAGDECTTAVTANDGANAFTTVGTPAASDVTSCATGDVFDTWFTYTATCTGTLVISTCDDADFNTSLGVYDACGGTELACNDDAAGCSGSTSEVTLSAAVNDVLLIRVSGTGGTTGSGNVSITCYPAVLYSQASGDSGDPIWDRVPVGTPGAEAFSRYTSLVIQNGHVITQDLATVEANSFTVESGGSYDMNGANALELEGDLTVDGTFDPSSGIVRLNGSSLQNIAGAATVDVYDLELDNAAGAVVLADSVHVYRTLDLLSGDFDANSNEVVLMSDASGTARLGPVDPSASYTGFLR
ncbi:MAG: hypothetical protein KDC02_16000, partial [Flavobacteriales bacterium]|nr:hypothetical protein [Flavobacteriales bacterium]